MSQNNNSAPFKSLPQGIIVPISATSNHSNLPLNTDAKPFIINKNKLKTNVEPVSYPQQPPQQNKLVYQSSLSTSSQSFNLAKQNSIPPPPVPEVQRNLVNHNNLYNFPPTTHAPPFFHGQLKPNNQYAIGNQPIGQPQLNINSNSFNPTSTFSSLPSQQPNSTLQQTSSITAAINPFQNIKTQKITAFVPLNQQQNLPAPPSSVQNKGSSPKASLSTGQTQNPSIVKRETHQEFNTMQSTSLIGDMSCHQAKNPTKTINLNQKETQKIVQSQSNVRYHQDSSDVKMPQFGLNFDGGVTPQQSVEECKSENQKQIDDQNADADTVLDQEKEEEQSEQIIEIRDLIKIILGENKTISKVEHFIKFKEVAQAKQKPRFILPNLQKRNFFQKEEASHKGFSSKFTSGPRRNTFKNYSYNNNNNKRKDQQQSQQYQHYQSQLSRKDIGGGYSQNRQQNWQKGKVNKGLSQSHSGFSRSEFKPKSEQQKKMQEEAKNFQKLAATGSDPSYNKIKISLNKITPDNFDKISSQLADIYAQDCEKNIDIIIEVTMKKAQNQDKYTQMYANLIEVITLRELKQIGQQFQVVYEDKKKKFKLLDKSKFRVALIKKCQSTFHSIFCEMVDEEKKDLSQLNQLKSKNNEQDIEEIQNIELRMQIRRKQKLGTIRFIGQILMKDLVNHKIAYSIIDQLIKQNDNSAFEMCTKFITQIGRYFTIQFKKRKEEIEKRLQTLRKVYQSNTLDKRNLLELSQNKFEQLQLSSKQGPMTINDVHASVQQQQQHQQQRGGPIYSQSQYQVTYRPVQQMTLVEKIQEEKHRKSIVTKSGYSSGNLSNTFNFYASAGGDQFHDNQDEQNKIQSALNGIHQVTSEKGEQSGEEDDQKSTKNEQSTSKQESEEFINSVHQNFNKFCEQKVADSDQFKNCIKEGYRFYQILGQLLNYVLIDVKQQDSEKFLPYFEVHCQNLNLKSSQNQILKGTNYFLEKFYINIASDLSETKFELFVKIIQTWVEKDIIEL